MSDITKLSPEEVITPSPKPSTETPSTPSTPLTPSTSSTSTETSTTPSPSTSSTELITTSPDSVDKHFTQFLLSKKRSYIEIFELFSSENDYTLANGPINDIKNITYKKSSDRVLTTVTNKMPETPKKKQRFRQLQSTLSSEY